MPQITLLAPLLEWRSLGAGEQQRSAALFHEYIDNPKEITLEYVRRFPFIAKEWFTFLSLTTISSLWKRGIPIANASGLGGAMFSLDKLESALRRISSDIKQHYHQVLAGDENVWKKIDACLLRR